MTEATPAPKATRRRKAGRSRKTIDAAELQARVKRLEEDQRRLEAKLAQLSGVRGIRIVKGRHIAEPATAKEIREALGVKDTDVLVVRDILKEVG